MLKSTAHLLFASFILASCSHQNETRSNLSADSTTEECAPPQVFTERQLPPSHTQSVLRVTKAVLKVTCTTDASGWTRVTRKNHFEVEIKNLAFHKRISLLSLDSQFSNRIVLDPSEVEYLGSTDDGYDKFSFSSSESFNTVQLSAILPAEFNTHPNIGNPQPGWTGPTYSVILELAQ